MRLAPHRLVHAVTLGLALAASTLAYAAPKADQIQAHRARLQAHLQQHDELTAATQLNTNYSTPIQYLREHDHRFHPERGGVRISSQGDHHLEVMSDGVYVRAAGTVKRAEVNDLILHGIKTRAAFDTRVSERLHATAGVQVSIGSEQAAINQIAMRYQDADRLKQNLRTSDMTLLIEHHRDHLLPRDQSPSGVPIIGNAQHGIHVAGGAVHYAAEGTTHALEFHHLLRFGIDSTVSYARALERALMAAAEVTGNHDDPAAVDQARGIVQARVNDAQRAAAMIASPSSHPDIALVRRVQQTIGVTSSNDQHPLEVATSGAARLVVRTTGTDQIVVISPEHPEGRTATLKDLVQFGLGDRTKLDHAISQALLSIAPEDLL